jgi:hypothetical protein
VTSPNNQEFSELASEKSSGIVSEMLAFLKHNKKWWLAQLIIVLLLVGVLVILGGSAAAPFIYTLF